jgi:hypothetical protein
MQPQNASLNEPSWLPALPRVLTAAMTNFMFGYHIGYEKLKKLNLLKA